MGGVATVTAALSHPSSAAVTLTVAASAVAPAVAGDFTLSAAKALTIAAGATVSSGRVTVTAADNDVDSPNKRLRISAAAAGGRGVADPAAAALTLADDDALPVVTLVLSPSSISEGGGISTVTAELSAKSSEAVTITVSAAPAAGAVLTDFSLSGARALTVAAGATVSTGTVTVTGVNDAVRQTAAKRVTISGAAAGGNGVPAPADVTLEIADNDSTPSPETWTGATSYGGAVHTDSLLGKTEPQPLSLSSHLDWGPYGLTAWACTDRKVRRSTLRAGTTEDQPDASVCTQLSTYRSPPPGTIRLTQEMIDDDGVVIVLFAIVGSPQDRRGTYVFAKWVPIVPLPKATLSLSSPSIWESSGAATVTATLDKAAVSASTLTVSVSPSPPATAGDFALSAPATLTFAQGATAGAGLVTIRGVNNPVDAPDKRVTVRAAASEDLRAPPPAALTLRDDDDPPTASLAASPPAISEAGGLATVTATLSHPSSAPTTVTVSASAGAHAAAADFRQAGAVLVVAAGERASAGLVTVAAVDNGVDSPSKRVALSGSASNRRGVGAVSEGTLTIEDDEAAPTLSLALMPASISEAGGVATVTAALSGRSSEAVTVTISAAAGANAAEGDFTLGPAATLTVAAGATVSAGTVTITAVDNAVDSADKRVTISGAATGGLGVAGPPALALAIRDDEGAAAVSLILSSSSISEAGGVATLSAALNRAAGADVTMVFTATPGATQAGYAGSANSLTVAAGQTASSDADRDYRPRRRGGPARQADHHRRPRDRPARRPRRPTWS